MIAEVFGLSEDVFALFRRFRHDLFNDLQILSGHMQLGRSTEVLRADLNVVIERIQEVSRLFSCKNDQLALLLWFWQEQARDREVSISFEIDQPSALIDIARLADASDLVTAALDEIVLLDDEEHWLHVRVDGSTPALCLTFPILPKKGVIETYRSDSNITCTETDEQLEYCFPLT